MGEDDGGGGSVDRIGVIGAGVTRGGRREEADDQGEEEEEESKKRPRISLPAAPADARGPVLLLVVGDVAFSSTHRYENHPGRGTRVDCVALF